MRRRILCFILCLVLVIGLSPLITPLPVHAATTSQKNIVARANYLYSQTWICKQTVSGWRGNYTFSKGSTYRLPYGQPINSGKYIGFGVSIEDFLAAANTAGSVFYKSRSSYGSTHSVYYAIDCSAFVSWCWGVSRKTTYSISQISTSLGAPTVANTSKLQLGDALNSRSAGHVVLVTGLTYSGSTLTKIEITEQTPPQLKRTTYTPSALASKYAGSYTILRYSGSVPAAPGSSGSSSGSSGSSTNGKYFPACASSHTSIIAALDSIGVDSTKSYRTTIAEANGMSGYTGTADENVALLGLLKAGQLINPEYKEGGSNVKYFPACGASCITIAEGLTAIGVDSSKDYRTKIAAANGIANYSGTVEQNNQMLNLLKAGMLINPDGSSGSGSGSSSGTGSFANGYEKGYTGGMPGDGKIYAHGLDVSKWQGSSLNFNAIKNAGYDYVILKAGSTNGKDECFETFYTNARAAGLDIGAYYYTYATTVAGAQTDAANMLTFIKGKTFEYPIYFDYEDPCQDGLSTTTAQNICLTFCDAMAKAGYLTGVYTGYAKATQLPMSTICAKYEAWIARYYDYTYETLSPSYSTKYGMYQYTDRNYIGSAGPYDANVAYKDYPAIVKKYGFNGYAQTRPYLEQCTVSPTHCKVTVTNATPLNTLPCSTASSYGSQTLANAEVGQTYTANAIYRNLSNNYWYQVTLENGDTAYLYSGSAVYTESISTDLTISDAVAPGTLPLGEGFEISGKVKSVLNRLGEVEVGIYSANTPVTTIAITPEGNACDLSEIALEFNKLKAGNYTYCVKAKYSGVYAAAAQQAATYTAQVTLMAADFTIVDGSITPDVDPDSYWGQCTLYPTHGQIRILQTAALNTLPCNAGSNGSLKLADAQPGQTYIATALYRSPDGTHWYQTTLDSGESVYVVSTAATFVTSVSTDISLSNASTPKTLSLGGTFGSSGTVVSKQNRLDEVEVIICTADGLPVTRVAFAADITKPDLCDLTCETLDFVALEIGNYLYQIIAHYSGYYTSAQAEIVAYSDQTILMNNVFTVIDCTHSFTPRIVQAETCTEPGILEEVCINCGLVNRSTIAPTGHNYVTTVKEPTCISAGLKTTGCTRCSSSITEPISALGHSYTATVIPPTCTQNGYTIYTCHCDESYVENVVKALGHSYTNGLCALCGEAEPGPPSIRPTLTLKSPTLEFKDMIRINAFYTAENTQDVVEMGMITYGSKVDQWSVETAEHVIPGATYVESSGRYYSSSQGIHAKYLADTVYLACYAKLTDGSYVYTKLAPYSAITYANSQLKNSTDTKLKQLVVAMLNYGTEAQLYFGHHVGSLANTGLSTNQMALPDAYRPEMVSSVPSTSAAKQGIFVNNQGFASRKPAISFEGAFCINYFFTPKYAPTGGITLYYWNAADYNAADVLTAANATGKIKLEGSGTGEYRGDITGISAKNLSEAVYVAAAYKSGGAVWTSGVLGYSIGSYCSSQAGKGGAIADLAIATAVYGYHAKQYFG